MSESNGSPGLSGASPPGAAPGSNRRILTRRTSFGLSKTLAKFARTEGLKLEANDAIPIIDRIDNILVTSPNASSGHPSADSVRVVVGAVWRKECVEHDSTGRDPRDDRAWVKHLAVVRAGLLLLIPGDTEEADLMNLHTTVRPLGFLRLKGASITCSTSESDESGGEARLGSCLLHITEMPCPPAPSPPAPLAPHTTRSSLASIAEVPLPPPSLGPLSLPVHAVLACRSATQARRWERVLTRAAALCPPPKDPSPRHHNHHHHPHASDGSDSLGISSSRASSRGGSGQLSQTSRFLLTSSTSSATSLGGHEHRHRDGFPFKEGHLHLLTPQGGRVAVVCRLEKGQLIIQPMDPHEDHQGGALPRRLALHHFRVAQPYTAAQSSASGSTGGEAAGASPPSLTLEPLPPCVGLHLNCTSRCFGGSSMSLSLTQSVTVHPPPTSRLFCAPSSEREESRAAVTSPQPFQLSGMGMSLSRHAMEGGAASERPSFGEGTGEEGGQGPVTLVCGDTEECATWRSLLTRSIRLATLGVTQRTATGTRRVRTHRRQVTASSPRANANANVTGPQQSEDQAAALEAHRGPVLCGEARVLVEGLLRGHWLFHSIADLNPLLDTMTLATPALGDVITWQGEGVSCLYVVECGLLEATTAPLAESDEAVSGDDDWTQDGPTRTMLARGAMVGEVALVHNSASEATVRVAGADNAREGADNARGEAEGCRLWMLTRQSFRALLHAALSRQQQHKCAFLRTLPLFAHLIDAQVSTVAETLQCVVVERGDTVGGQGQEAKGPTEGAHLFLLRSGTAIATQGQGNDHEGEEEEEGGRERRGVVLGAGDWVADVACMGQGTQGGHIQVRATGRLECYVVSGAELHALLGTQLATQALQTAAQAGRLALHFGSVPSPPSPAPARPPIPPPTHASSAVDYDKGDGDGYPSDSVGSEGMDPHLSLRSLRHVKVMGRGSFGKVVLVAHEGSGGDTHMALKVLSKHKLQMTRQVAAVQCERGLLSDVSLRAHPFVVSLLRTFQDQHRVYMLLELLPGGELWTLLHGEEPPPVFMSGPYGGLPTQACAFYVAQCVSVLSHLHAHCHVIYRDLKPENLCMDTHGYLKLVDFGFAKRLQAEGDRGEARTLTVCGTPEYLAPEIVRGNGYGYAADLWSLGVLTFELLAVYTPFQAPGPMQVYEKVCRSEVTLAEEVASLDPPLDPQAHSFIAALLHPNPALRLGACGVGMEGLWSHPLLCGVDHVALRHRALAPPYVPALQDPADAPVSQSYGDEDDEFEDEDEGEEDEGGDEGQSDVGKGTEAQGGELGPPTGTGVHCGRKGEDEFEGF